MIIVYVFRKKVSRETKSAPGIKSLTMANLLINMGGKKTVAVNVNTYIYLIL